jgi:hypothetical protein
MSSSNKPEVGVFIVYAMIKPGIYGYEVRTADDLYRLLLISDTEKTARDYCNRNGLAIVE